MRSVDLVTAEPEGLAAVQPERRREYVRIRPGGFEGALRERSDGVVAVARECWSSALRVRCARPRSYVVFSVVDSIASSLWCGLRLDPASVIEIDRDWEITTQARLQSSSFAVERGALERIEALLSGGAAPARTENRILEGHAWNAERLRNRVENALAAEDLGQPAREALQASFLHLAARLRLRADPGISRVESGARRRAAVRHVEDFLEAHEREVPSLAELCGVAGVSERTLEYAFREHLGLTPVLYLRLRRLGRVRRELRAAPAGTRVTDVAMRWGFWQLGRFAAEYRVLFGERPSDTLNRSRR